MLNAINPTNLYSTNPSTPLPTNTTETYNSEIQYMDEKYKIISISKSRSQKLVNQCFITFTDEHAAFEFMQKFKSKLKICGKNIDIEYAHKDSLLAVSLYNDRPTLFQKVLNTRHKSKILQLDNEIKKLHSIKRSSRRLRAKLRKEGMDETTIAAKVEEFKNQMQYNTIEESKIEPISDSTKVEAKEREIKKKEQIHKVSENPPSTRLLVQNLPQGTTDEELKLLFYDEGFKNIRLLSVRNLAFIEYNSIENASHIKEKLGNKYSWKESIIYIGFAK